MILIFTSIVYFLKLKWENFVRLGVPEAQGLGTWQNWQDGARSIATLNTCSKGNIPVLFGTFSSFTTVCLFVCLVVVVVVSACFYGSTLFKSCARRWASGFWNNQNSSEFLWREPHVNISITIKFTRIAKAKVHVNTHVGCFFKKHKTKLCFRTCRSATTASPNMPMLDENVDLLSFRLRCFLYLIVPVWYFNVF